MDSGQPTDHASRPRTWAKAAAAALAFSFLMALLVAINGFSVQLALLFAFLSLFFVATVLALLVSSTEAYRKKKLEEGLAEFFYRAIYYKSRSGSYLRAVDKAVQGTSERVLKGMAGRASKSLKLGGGFLSGVDSRGELKDGALLKGLRPGGTDELSQMRSALAAHELHTSGSQSAVEESSQRYATINMFVSTVAPSFLVFAFIGTAILSQAGVSLLLFSVSLLIFIPLSYAIGNSFLSRRMYA